MGEADLIVLGSPAHLRGEAIGDPEVRPNLAEEFRHHILAAARPDDEAAVGGVMEHPGPPGPLADAHAGLVRLQNAAGKQASTDQARLPRKGRPAGIEDIDQGAFADLDPGVKIIILGMLKIIGGGFVTLGLALMWLCFALHGGAGWAPWAMLSVSAVALGPMLYVAVQLRAFRPEAQTPVRPTLAMMVLIVAGVGLSLLA